MSPASKPLRLLVLAGKWGDSLMAAARARGVETRDVDPDRPGCPAPEGMVREGWTLFARVNQLYPEEGRAWSLRFIEAGGRCVQSAEDIRCYENRAYQMRRLEDWYPRGRVFQGTRPCKEAVDSAIAELGLPIVSKARFGSSSKTVRALHSRKDVDAELTEVFGQGKRYGDKLQYAECLWQSMVHGNTSALRIARVTDDYGWLFHVQNRPHDWRASGSGTCRPIPLEMLRQDERLRKAVRTFLDMADRGLQSRWCAADLLYDRIAGLWLVVDVTLAWNLSRNLAGANYDAEVINLCTLEHHPRHYRGRDQWEVLLEDLGAGR